MDDNQIGSLIISLIIGLLVSGSGLLLMKKPPKDINGFIGYRTTRSMKNMTLWKEGNVYSGFLMSRFGIILAIIGVVLSLLISKVFISFLMLLLLVASSILMIILVERKLKGIEMRQEDE